MDTIPRWSLDSIYTGFTDQKYLTDKERLVTLIGHITKHLEDFSSLFEQSSFEVWLETAIQLEEKTSSVLQTLSSYTSALYTTDTQNDKAVSEINSIEEMSVPLAKLSVQFLNCLSVSQEKVFIAIQNNPLMNKFSFFLKESLFMQKKQMTSAEEDLAADLDRCGSSAWARLQEQLTATADCLWDPATGERKTLVDVRSLAHSKDRSVREKAFQKEQEICSAIALPVAACINGIKGTSITLSRRRFWDDDLQKAVRQANMSQKALDALIVAMEESLPHWRRYLQAKASLLGLDRCAFYDLFAPVGAVLPTYSFEDVQNIVSRSFYSFSQNMGTFAEHVFASNWIDAEPRAGKIGGAYCTDMPEVKETRVMCNFDGTFNSVTTIAHELGHAFHSWVLKDESVLHHQYPMILAETASIFAETIVFTSEVDRLDRSATDQKLALLEMHLQDGCQILVDILSRFYFERAVFEDRKKGELSASDLCQKMKEAQEKTYGDGLDVENLHPYMWLVKPHYYSSDISFYNFPYAFGQLFGMALYSRFAKEGPPFADIYESLLKETGRMDAVSLSKEAGFDIEDPAFWRSGIAVFLSEIEEFITLVQEKKST